MDKGITVYFDFDIRKFEGNPLYADTPFGKPEIISTGNQFDVLDEAQAELESIRRKLEAARRHR